MSSGGLKYDNEKPRLDLLPPAAIVEVGRVLGYGAAKYGEHNYLKVRPAERYLAAALRHIVSILDNRHFDDESGHLHAAHAATSLLMYMEIMLRGSDNGEP